MGPKEFIVHVKPRGKKKTWRSRVYKKKNKQRRRNVEWKRDKKSRVPTDPFVCKSYENPVEHAAASRRPRRRTNRTGRTAPRSQRSFDVCTRKALRVINKSCVWAAALRRFYRYLNEANTRTTGPRRIANTRFRSRGRRSSSNVRITNPHVHCCCLQRTPSDDK